MMTEISKAEALAINLARGKAREQWVLRHTDGTFRVVDCPIFGNSVLSDTAVRQWLPKLGLTFESAFSSDGRRIV